jgi:penicillin-binding protein 1C
LNRLHEAGDLTRLDLDLALSEPLAAEPHDLPDLAPHLLDTLLRRTHPAHRIVTTLDARSRRTPRSSRVSTPHCWRARTCTTPRR